MNVFLSFLLVFVNVEVATALCPFALILCYFEADARRPRLAYELKKRSAIRCPSKKKSADVQKRAKRRDREREKKCVDEKIAHNVVDVGRLSMSWSLRFWRAVLQDNIYSVRYIFTVYSRRVRLFTPFGTSPRDPTAEENGDG